MRLKWQMAVVVLVGASVLLVAQSQNSGTSSGQGKPSAPIFSPDGTVINGAPDQVPPDIKPLPKGVILVPGAVASASDSTTPLPEGGTIADNIYANKYFGMNYPFPANFYQKVQGPPPSDSGSYVLAQLAPNEKFKGPIKGTIVVSAQDLFFSLATAGNTAELVTYTRDHLGSEFKVERQPEAAKIANHTFVRFDYVAPAADLHFYMLATQIRCHTVRFMFMSRDSKLIENFIQDMNRIKLPEQADAVGGTGGGDVPVCVKGYATAANITSKVEPVLTDRKFNPIPVRIIISKTGRVKHIHFLSAFPEQAKIISQALEQWTFKPYLVNGEPVEVETGILFGNSPNQAPVRPRSRTAAVTN